MWLNNKFGGFLFQLNFVTVINLAVKVFPFKNVFVKGHVTVDRIFFRNRNRAGIKINASVGFFAFRYMGMAVKENISLFYRRQLV